MATITPASMADFVATTLLKFEKGKWENAMQTFQQNVTLDVLYEKERVLWDSGRGFQHNVALNFVNTARWTGLFAEGAGAQYDHLQQMSIHWATLRAEWVYDYTQTLMNRGESLISSLIEPNEANCMQSIAETLENQTWTVPATTDTDKIWGIPYWVVYNATDGFTGATPGSFTTVGGINPSTYTGWKNYSGTFNNVSKTSAVRVVKTGLARKLRWKSPNSTPNKDLRASLQGRYRLYTNDQVMSEWEDAVLEGQDDNLGTRESAPATVGPDGTWKVLGFDVIYVPALDSLAATNSRPIYALDHSTLFVAGLKGNWFRSKGPYPLNSTQPDVYRTDKVLTSQIVCVNRRRNAVFAKSAPF